MKEVMRIEGLGGLDDFGAVFKWSKSAAARKAALRRSPSTKPTRSAPSAPLKATVKDRLRAKAAAMRARGEALRERAAKAREERQKTKGPVNVRAELAAQIKSGADLARAAELDRIADVQDARCPPGMTYVPDDEALTPASAAIPERYGTAEAVKNPQTAEFPPWIGFITPSSEELATFLSGFSEVLGESEENSAAVIRAYQRHYVGFIAPSSLLTKEGAARLGIAGARAAAASKMYKAQGDEIESRITAAHRQSMAFPEGSPGRVQKDVEYAVGARQLLRTRANQERSRVIASGSIAALNFRKQAQDAAKSGRTAEVRRRLGQAAAAVVATQGFAKTPVHLELPEELSRETINANAVSIGMQPPIVNSSSDVFTGFIVPKLASPAAKVKFASRPEVTIPEKLRVAFQKAPYATVPEKQKIDVPNAALIDEDEVTSHVAEFLRGGGLSGLGDLGFIGSIVNAVGDVAKAVVPSHTIVGKVLRGDVTGATKQTLGVKDAAREPTAAEQQSYAEVMSELQKRESALSADQLEVLKNVTGSFSPQSTTQKVLLVGAGVLGVGLLAIVAKRKMKE